MKLTIDGIAVEVEKGRTILEAAQACGVKIPTLWPRLEAYSPSEPAVSASS